MPSDRDESVKAQEAYWYWRNRAGKVEPVMVRSVVESPDAVAREEIERLEIELTNAANGALVNRYVKEARKEAQDAKAKLDEARGLLAKAMEWAAGYPLQGSGSHADHGAANDVYQSIRAFLDPPTPAAESPEDEDANEDEFTYNKPAPTVSEGTPRERHFFMGCTVITLIDPCKEACHYLPPGTPSTIYNRCGKPASDPIHAPAPSRGEARRGGEGMTPAEQGSRKAAIEGPCLACGLRLTRSVEPINDYIECPNCRRINVYKDSFEPVALVASR